MNTNWILGAVIIVALAIGVGVFVLRAPHAATTTTTDTPATNARPLKTYYDPTYGIAFNYPDNYVVQEHDATDAGTKHHTIVVGDKDALSSTANNGEAPPVISIDIYNNSAKQSAEKWIKGNDLSNYKLSQNAPLSSTTVAGIPALAYAWDGLYASNSIVFAEKNKIYMLSVGYNAPQDQLRKDFAQVVASIQFDP